MVLHGRVWTTPASQMSRTSLWRLWPSRSPSHVRRRAIIPVQNIVDDMSWTKRTHNFQFGVNLRLIDDRRVSNANSFPDGQMNQGWLSNGSTVANSGGPFDPPVYGFPAVDFANYGNEYNAALLGLVGIVTEGDAIYNYDKNKAIHSRSAPLSHATTDGRRRSSISRTRGRRTRISPLPTGFDTRICRHLRRRPGPR